VIDSSFSRRLFLKSAALGGAAAALGGWVEEVRGSPSPYGPFKMGVQTYTFRAFPLADALAKTKAVGLSYCEVWDGHMPVTDDPARLAAYRAALKAAGVRALTYGVIDFGADREANRRRFQFARALGLGTLSANPSPEAFDSLDELVREFKINIAIHNHGPGNRYSKIQGVADALKGRDPRVGACVDAGHYLRSGEDPVEAVRRFGRRTYGVHLKDVKDDRFTELGKGDLNLPALLTALKELHHGGVLSLEYEEHPQDVMPYVEECLAATRAAVEKVAGQPDRHAY